MNKVYMLPTPSIARKDRTNAINQIVLRLEPVLPEYGWDITEHKSEADLIVGHAGQTDGQTAVDIAHCHGLNPTYQFPEPDWQYAGNAHVIKNLLEAKQVTAPSRWVAELLARDMHLSSHVFGWGINHNEWEPPKNNGGYVLWNKTRATGVCNPAPMQRLAERAREIPFLTTFGDTSENVKVTGRLAFDHMRPMIQYAGIYLATTKETFGIGTIEAMACGVPVLGYNWGGTADIVDHGVTGFLAEPGDIDGLEAGLRYVITHHRILSANARKASLQYTWHRIAEQFASLYRSTLNAMNAPRPKVSVVIPCHNYGHYVRDAIMGVYHQTFPFDIELIVVNDNSGDNSQDVINTALNEISRTDIVPILIEGTYGGPAAARNRGIEEASGEYILCIDADDMIDNPAMLSALAARLDDDPSLGIAFTGLQAIDGDNNRLKLSGWPNGFDFEKQVKRQNQVPTCCMYRREAWVRAGGYRTRFEPAEDAELWLRMTSLGYKAEQVTTEPWFIYRMHGDSLSAPVRNQLKNEPNWLRLHPWTHDSDLPRPFAALSKDGKQSGRVRNYDNPLISVIIPVGPGHEKIVTEALDTLEAQTFWNWEALVINDTGELLQLPAHPFAKIIEPEPDRWAHGVIGAGASRNVGVQEARGSLVAFLDADDLWEPEFLYKALRKFNQTGRYVYTDWISISKDGSRETHVCPDYELHTVFTKGSIHGISVLIPKADVIAVGGFAEDMGAWEDVDFYMRLAKGGFCGVRLAEPLLIYRYRTGSLREHGETIKDELKEYLRERYVDYMGGKADMCCGDPPRAKTEPIAQNDEDMIRVQYVGDKAPLGKATLLGPVTKHSYGRRARGEVFMVWKQDYESLSDRLEPYQEFQPVASQTVIPTEPTAT